MVDRDAWQPPPTPTRTHQDRVPGAMGGSYLLNQPQYQAQLQQIRAFVVATPKLAVEVGFDHGIQLLANARAFPTWSWLGVEIRRKRVEAVAANAPPNCLPTRLDGRTLFAAVLEDESVDRVDVLFPTPALKSKHMLWTPAFVADVWARLKPGGVLHMRTDVPALADLLDRLIAQSPDPWAVSDPPARTPDLSRRERVCLRDKVPIAARTLRKVAGIRQKEG